MLLSTQARKVATGRSKQQLSVCLMTSNVMSHLLICSISLAMKLYQSCMKTQRHLVINRSTLLGSHILVKMACTLCMLGQVLSGMRGLFSNREE